MEFSIDIIPDKHVKKSKIAKVIRHQERMSYLLISWVTNHLSNLGFLDMFIRDDIDRELHSLERLELKYGLSSEFFVKISVRILLIVLYRAFRFSKPSFYVLASSFMTF